MTEPEVAVSRNRQGAAAELRALLRILVTRKVTDWTNSNEIGPEVPPVPLEEGNIVTSRFILNDRHVVLLDIDYPAYLVRSSTPGHYHLYLDVPGGIEHEAYMLLLDRLADVNIIERAYAEASNRRGFSAVRLPWVKKGDANG